MNVQNGTRLRRDGAGHTAYWIVASVVASLAGCDEIPCERTTLRLMGRVTGGGGSLAGAVAWTNTSAGQSRVAAADQDGVFTIDLPLDAYNVGCGFPDVQVMKLGCDTAMVRPDNSADSEWHTVSLRCPGQCVGARVVTGTMRDASGAPLARGHLAVCQSIPIGGSVLSFAGENPSASSGCIESTTDANGRFSITVPTRSDVVHQSVCRVSGILVRHPTCNQWALYEGWLDVDVTDVATPAPVELTLRGCP